MILISLIKIVKNINSKNEIGALRETICSLFFILQKKRKNKNKKKHTHTGRFFLDIIEHFFRRTFFPFNSQHLRK